MSNVQSWVPSKHTLSQTHRDLLNAVVVDDPTVKQLQLTTEQLDTLKDITFIDANEWAEFATAVADEELVHWIKLLSLIPEQHPGFNSGASSPVIPLVRVLRQRGGYPTSLTAWIKQHSTNRFLPYGSLADRLAKT